MLTHNKEMVTSPPKTALCESVLYVVPLSARSIVVYKEEPAPRINHEPYSWEALWALIQCGGQAVVSTVGAFVHGQLVNGLFCNRVVGLARDQGRVVNFAKSIVPRQHMLSPTSSV